MQSPLEQYCFKVTPLFQYIQKQAGQTGAYIYYNNSKETLQIFRNKESYKNGDKYIGAIQYEGSNNYVKKEPELVSFRFKRDNLSSDLRQALEAIISFRRDKNKGPAINPEAESIAFKFKSLDEVGTKETISEITSLLRRHLS